MSSDCVFVILADKVDKTVNFVEISVEVVKPILEVWLQEYHFVAQGVVRSLEVVEVLKSFLCPHAFGFDVNILLVNFLTLASNSFFKGRLNLRVPILLVVELFPNIRYFLSGMDLFFLQLFIALSNFLSE